MTAALPIGVGLGWRPETAWLVDLRASLAFSEVIAETVDPRRPPPALAAAIERGLPVVAHGVGLDLGGARLDRDRVRRFARVARALRSPIASEHVAFCRAGDLESPHFLPVPLDRAQLAVLVDNVRRVQDALHVPLALENIAAPLVWPGNELAEADFLAELLDRTGALLLLDVANLHANLVNHGGDLAAYLARIPLARVAYMHAAGGARIDATGMWRDTHAHPITSPILDTLAAVLARTGPVPVLLERDHGYGNRSELETELDALERVMAGAAPTRHVAADRARLPELATPTATTRAELAERHRGLVAALTTDATDPAGMDPSHVAEARAIVTRKLARHAPHPPARRWWSRFARARAARIQHAASE